MLLDCTYTLMLGGHTGCQRVVRNLVKSLPAVAAEKGVEVVPVVLTSRGLVPVSKAAATGFIGGHYYGSLKTLTLIPGPRFIKRKFMGLIKGKEAGKRKIVVRNVAAPAADALPGELIEPAPGVPENPAFKRLRLFLEGSTAFPGQWVPGRTLTPGPGDVVMLADTTWHLVEMAHWIDKWHAAGAKVAGVLYDLIPLSHPQFVITPFSLAFRQWCATVLPRLDLAACISAATEQAVRQLKHVCPKQTSWFHLGGDLDQAPAGGPSVSDEWRKIWSAEVPPWVMVGTIEPRKDYMTVIDAFERLWASGDERAARQSLVICGRGGWLNDALVRRMECHPEAGRRFWWYTSADDAAIDFAYAHCRGLITASRVEGFNLPVVEALRHGAFVLASDLAVHREVAYAAPAEGKSFFPPGDAVALAAEILRRPEVVPRLTVTPIDWTESCRQLLDGIIRALS